MTKIEKNTYNFLNDMNQTVINKWLLKLNKTKLIAFSFNTISHNQKNYFIENIYFAINKKENIQFSIDNKKYSYSYDKIKKKSILHILKPLFENPKILKVGINLKLNYHILNRYNIKLINAKFDILLEYYILKNKINIKSYNNKEIISLNENQTFFSKYYKLIKEIKSKLISIFNPGKKKQIIPSNKIFQFHKIMWNQLKKEKKTKFLFETIDIPLIKVLFNIEKNGILIDLKKLKKYSVTISEKIKLLENKAHQLAGEKFNISSTKEVQNILFNKLSIYPTEKTKKNTLSTNKHVLKQLSNTHPLPKIILKYRSLYKIKSTYINKLPTMTNCKTGRIHTTYNQTITTTGRLSSIKPNLQNIPIHSKFGKLIRKTFIPESGTIMLSADYSQIELRIMAHLSKDQTLINAFLKNQDVHSLTASEILNIPIKNILSKERQIGKTINFGLVYGMTAFGLSKQLNIHIAKAQKYINYFFKKYPNILKHIKKSKRIAQKKGFVTTLEGRKLYIANIQSNNLLLRNAAERFSINGPIQSLASDIIKRAMIKIDCYLKLKYPIEAKIVLQIHDELIFEIKKDKFEKITKEIKILMEDVTLLDVPIKVNIKSGKNWADIY